MKAKWIIILHISLLATIMSKASAEEKLLHITTGEWQPYMSSKMPNKGIISHIVTEAFHSTGYKVSFSFYPWKRAEILVHKELNKWDASCCWWESNERKNTLLLSSPIHHSDVVFFHLKNKKIEWNQISDLHDYKIGTTIGYDYGSELDEARRRATIEINLAASDQLNFKKLAAGRIDIFPNDPIVGFAQLRKLYPQEKVSDFTFHPKRLINTYLHLAVSKNKKGGDIIIKDFNRGLKIIRSNGLYEKIITGR